MVHSLRALDTLCLGSNWIRELPPWLGDLHLLRHLDVSKQIRAPWQAGSSTSGSSGRGEGGERESGRRGTTAAAARSDRREGITPLECRRLLPQPSPL